tara:strand:+ start:79 stop:297 length:219 start_codon:yes stop_codon:yes gene_type:complete
MPFEIKKFKGGYKVYNKEKKKYYSLKPIPKKNAEAQMRRLDFLVGTAGKKNVKTNNPKSRNKLIPSIKRPTK